MQSYIQKKKLASLIVKEIKNNYEMFDYFGKSENKVDVVYGIVESEIKIEETSDGFRINVPFQYGEEYVKECIEKATESWLSELELEGKVSEE